MTSALHLVDQDHSFQDKLTVNKRFQFRKFAGEQLSEAALQKPIIIQVKSLFLLLVFSMNIIAGFACAVGIDMGYNKGHHVRKHSAGHVKKRCQHENKKGHNQHSADNKSQSDQTKDDCCKNGVTAFSLLDKSVEKASSLNVPVFYVAQLPALYPGIFPGYSSIHIDKKSLVRGHHPPIRDIRIAIQSFQV